GVPIGLNIGIHRARLHAMDLTRVQGSDIRRVAEVVPRPRPGLFMLRMAVLLAGIGLAQAVGTGTLVVKTTDKDGSPFPGVAVEITNSQGSPVPASRRTDASGSTTFVLAVGASYTVKASADGFLTRTSEPFRLEAGSTTVRFTIQERFVERVRVK